MDTFEKKYNEALERARQKIDAGLLTKEDLSYIFPEFRESEDERMRKKTINCLTMHNKGCVDAKDIDECIAWLEKQKEQKPNYCHHEVDETGWTEEYRKAYYDGWNNCNMQHEQLKADQKPAERSEEDERIRQGLIKMYKNEHLVSVPIGVHAKDIIRFLENLRPSWKPSEEQMSALCLCIPKSRRPCTLQSLYNDLKKL